MFYVVHHKSTRVIVPTHYVAKDLKTLYPFSGHKIDVTYEATEPPIHEPGQPLEGIKKPFIMHVGSPFPHKNVKHLIQAFELLDLDYPDLDLVLVGKKEYYFKELEAWAKPRPSYESIKFTGFVEDNELKWLYENAEAFVLPSLSEGFGLPGLEAMSHGCPLISSNATCMPEVYEDAAQYFNPTDLKDTVAAIKKVLGNTEFRKKLIARGRTQTEKYSWQTMAEQTLEVYDAALEA